MTEHHGWTIVQHSGYGYGGKEGFARGVEVRSLSSKKDRKTVEKAGGLIFDSYTDATLFEDKVNLDGPGLYPQAQGGFSELTIDGLRIYIPVREAVR